MGPEGLPSPILLVEDHDLVATTLAVALRACGPEVASTSGPTPAAVLDAARLLRPALVLLDLDLGSLGSGLDLIGPLRALGATVVVLSGTTDVAQLGACLEAGAAGVLSKAAGIDLLLEALRRAEAGDDVMTAQARSQLVGGLQAHRSEERSRLAPFTALTPSERAVLAQLMEGASAEAVAGHLFVSVATVRSHIQAILRKLGVGSQLAAVAMARQARWSPDAIHQS